MVHYFLNYFESVKTLQVLIKQFLFDYNFGGEKTLLRVVFRKVLFLKKLFFQCSVFSDLILCIEVAPN